MKGKLGNAICSGTPIVTTSIGAEGLKMEDGENCFISDKADEFAHKCVHLYQDPVAWTNFALKAKLILADIASRRTVSRQLMEMFAGMQKKKVDKQAFHGIR
jgi:glycosyltransferase involved in cell wall biosynthesis